VRKREFELLGEELLDVWALNVISLLEFDNLQDLFEWVSKVQLRRSSASAE
jgi:hypothetical protein